MWVKLNLLYFRDGCARSMKRRVSGCLATADEANTKQLNLK